MQKLNELVPVNPGNIGGVTVSLVSAKKLHAFLGVGRDFTTWIKGRISQYGFTAGVDFTVVENLSTPVSGSAKYRQQIAHDYLITIDMGKELAMVERNEKGRQIRRYFIECEKKLRNIQPVQAEPQPQFTAEEIILLCYMQLWMEKAQDISKHLYPIMKELNSSYTNKLYDIAFETIYMVTKNRDALLREVTRLDMSSSVIQRAMPMLKSLRARQFEF